MMLFFHSLFFFRNMPPGTRSGRGSCAGFCEVGRGGSRGGAGAGRIGGRGRGRAVIIPPGLPIPQEDKVLLLKDKGLLLPHHLPHHFHLVAEGVGVGK